MRACACTLEPHAGRLTSQQPPTMRGDAKVLNYHGKCGGCGRARACLPTTTRERACTHACVRAGARTRRHGRPASAAARVRARLQSQRRHTLLPHAQTCACVPATLRCWPHLPGSTTRCACGRASVIVACAYMQVAGAPRLPCVWAACRSRQQQARLRVRRVPGPALLRGGAAGGGVGSPGTPPTHPHIALGNKHPHARQVVSLFFELLHHERKPELGLGPGSVVLVPPSLTFLLGLGGGSVGGRVLRVGRRWVPIALSRAAGVVAGGAGRRTCSTPRWLQRGTLVFLPSYAVALNQRVVEQHHMLQMEEALPSNTAQLHPSCEPSALPPRTQALPRQPR